jgi:hypothetical protein
LSPIDDIYYSEYGTETGRVKNDKPDRHFLQYGGETYRLDYGLKEGTTPYEIHADLAEGQSTAGSLSAGAPVYTNRAVIGKQSLPGGELDFKNQLPDRSLWNIGGMMAHKHAIGNMAWGNYMASRGFSLQESLRGARTQGFFAGGEDPLDQRMIMRGYHLGKR